MHNAINAAAITKTTVNKKSAASSCWKKKLLKDMSKAKTIAQAKRQFRPSLLSVCLRLVEPRRYLARKLKQAMICNLFFMIQRHVIHDNEPFIPSGETSVTRGKAKDRDGLCSIGGQRLIAEETIKVPRDARRKEERIGP